MGAKVPQTGNEYDDFCLKVGRATLAGCDEADSQLGLSRLAHGAPWPQYLSLPLDCTDVKSSPAEVSILSTTKHSQLSC